MSFNRPTRDEIKAHAAKFHEVTGRMLGFDQADWFKAEQYLSVLKNYDATALLFVDGGKVAIGSKNDRVCRYCTGTKPARTFRKTAHAIPELLGNKLIFSYDECDQCNEHFGRHVEDHLSKFLNLLLTVTGIKGKKGVPSARRQPGGSLITNIDDCITVKNAVGEKVGVIDEATQHCSINTETQPFIAIAAYKSLVKIAISIMPEVELVRFTRTIKWLLEPDHSVDANKFQGVAASVLHWHQPGNISEGSSRAILFQRKSDHADLPYMLLSVRFGATAFQIIVRGCANDSHLVGKEISHPIFPAFFDYGYQFGEASFDWYNLSSVTKESAPFETVIGPIKLEDSGD